ncbi:MAG: lipopolysaccharide transport periplasmic protein LptA [Casimicrobiaceae bacterium]
MRRPSPQSAARRLAPAVTPSRARIVFCAALLAPLLAAAPAQAERADRDKPIFYQGDTGGANLGSKDGELAGSVVITQGTLTIHADRITFRQNADNSLSATAYGNPVTFREKRDGMDEYYEGFAQRIVYDGAKRFLELFDRALLKKSNDEIRSNYITYDVGADVFKAEGRPDTRPATAGETPLGSRVRGVFQPQAKEEKAAKDPKAAKDGKAAPAPKANPPLPLKSDDALSLQPTK